MFQGTSLNKKLIGISLVLVFVSLGIISLICLAQLRAFGKETVDQSLQSLEQQSLDTLQAGVEMDRERIENYIKLGERDVKRLAHSSNLVGYISATKGGNEVMNQFAAREIGRIQEGILKDCDLLKEVLQKQVDSNLSVAEYVLKQRG
jgi:hypothetical protein